ncbi:MAG TPA: glycosyltransferase [Candidatus Limnocylindrales bacterium]|nr:glycosyltransferase [Candidatus Limnocylindrales bacterium]
MRALFTCVVGHGHFQPMVPLVAAFREAGHEVAVATDPAYCPAVRGLGFDAHPAGLDHVDARARFFASTPDWKDIAVSDRMRIQQAEMFGRIRVPRMLADLQRVILDWNPTLIVHDSLEMAGAIAAEAAGIAHAEHAVGILRPAAGRLASTAAVAPFSEALGVRNSGVGGLGGELYLDICSPGIQLPEIRQLSNVQPMRPVDFDPNPDEPPPAWMTASREDPIVYVTLGTVFNEAVDVFRTILAGLRDEPVQVLVTVGETADPAALGLQPANVHVERYIPQSRVLPWSSLMVSHAGSGAMLGAIKAGVPMLAVPQGADQFMNAEQCASAGLGLRLLPDELTPDSVRESVRRLLREGHFRHAVQRELAAIDSMPSPKDVVPVLVELAERGPMA